MTTGNTPAEDARPWPEDNPDKETLNIIGRLLFGVGKDSCAHNFNHESLVSRAGELTGEVSRLKQLDIRDDEIIHLHSQMAKALTDKEAAMLAASESDAMFAKQSARETEWLQAIFKAERERDEARAMAAELISRETTELLRADKARDEAFELASDKDGEIALLKSNLAKAVAEKDAARNERDRVWATAVSVGSANARLLTENSALKASNAELMSGVDKALESEELAISRGKEHLERQLARSRRLEKERGMFQDEVLTLRKQTGWRQFKDQKPTMDDADTNGHVSLLGTDGVLATVHIMNAGAFSDAWWRPTMPPVVFTPYHQWVKALTPDERAGLNSGNLRAIWDSMRKFYQKQNPGDPAKPPTRPAGEGWD